MSEEITRIAGTKEEQYRALIPQIQALLEGEPDMIANMANITAALKEQFQWFWVGFYLVKNNELILGPFQGPVACTRIQYGKGVCGKAWQEEQVLIVPNVTKFPGHIACSSFSKSEIVLPLIKNQKVFAVLDIDHHLVNYFDPTDRKYLEKIIALI
ncbi:MAG: GAF domain-containing protein [Bacteroidetes bacterium]|nr:GAF domain-containing protein [Bacteroidota bacterium]